jgi:hypothetical protein
MGAVGSLCIEYCNRCDQRIARQQLCKHGSTRNNRSNGVFYVHAKQWLDNRIMQPFSKQQLGNHTSA